MQQSLLKILDGLVVGFPERSGGGRINPRVDVIEIDINNIFLICGGAFAGQDFIVLNQLSTTSIDSRAHVDSEPVVKKGAIAT